MTIRAQDWAASAYDAQGKVARIRAATGRAAVQQEARDLLAWLDGIRELAGRAAAKSAEYHRDGVPVAAEIDALIDALWTDDPRARTQP